MTAPKLTDEMRQALAMRRARPIPIEDDQTQNFSVLLTRDDYSRELQIAFDQVDRGEVSDLDMKALLAEAHRRHAAKKANRA
jgi:hypothetical protein